ncbi:MAG: aminomethyl-transferring glycine dehydrogenase [Blastochloris sp.]|nr:aminomethyl-transferring glycine dehydrogenase [Blastochloris sp.]
MHTTLSSSTFSTQHPDRFQNRHIGPSSTETEEMLQALGFDNMETFLSQVVPADIRIDTPLTELKALSEFEALRQLKSMADRNTIHRSYLGMGYSDVILPAVIQRNILENPGWYTAYTPYQAEISQGRMEALLNYQTMVADLTGFAIANASLLDEGTAAAEAMSMCYGAWEGESENAAFFIAADCHPQTIQVVSNRAHALGVSVVVGDPETFAFDQPVFGFLLQYPNTYGHIHDYQAFSARAHEHKALVVVAADLMSLLLLTPPAEFGADVAVGCTQRFGMPMGFGGPHAAYFASHDEHKRRMPGRLIGVSKDSSGKPAMRLSLQTREQHIRRDKATSNICTAQVLPAVVASMYAVYHGPQQLKSIALRIHQQTARVAEFSEAEDFVLGSATFFDTITLQASPERIQAVLLRAQEHKVNLRILGSERLGISLDEAVTEHDLTILAFVLSGRRDAALPAQAALHLPTHLRSSTYLTHPVFNTHHSETELLRYMKYLENRDISLTYSMIALGSCTMKLNATAEMYPVTWPGFSQMHPFAPREQWAGYAELFTNLEKWLAVLTGFSAVSLQPNAGSQGEYAGLLAIKKYHEARGDKQRDVCLIPQSAHGTNFASAVMVAFKVVLVSCDDQGNVDLNDLKQKIDQHANQLAACMITYPSTHGVFETGIRAICDMTHNAGGQVYMDGANMNAQVCLTSPGAIGADVCHLNLHKTFCIPHGGGGPGMGPIGVAEHLAPYLPKHPLQTIDTAKEVGPVSAAPYGSGCILTISWAYIAMMGGEGLRQATALAILNANYMAQKLEPYYPILFKGSNGRVAHECILDLRGFKASAGIEVEDVAKRLIDYGFHAPTMSWPVAGTLMVEPTESESKPELDRFIDAMISIHGEIEAIAAGKFDKTDNPLKNAPHTAELVISDSWNRAYSREQAVYPAAWVRLNKYWPPVGRVDNVYGDRNLFCSCINPEDIK